jgi:hypothetical protein
MDDRGSSDPLDRGRTQAGAPVSRADLKPADLIKHEGVESRVSDLVSIGILKPSPSGGYEWNEGFTKPATDQSQQRAGDQNQEQQQEKPEPAVRLSPETESAIESAVSKAGGQTVSALVDALVDGKERAVAGITQDLAGRMGADPAHMTETVQKVTSEFQAQARNAVQMDEATFDVMTEWAWREHPDAVRSAIRAQVDNGQLAPLRSLAEKFKATGGHLETAAELGHVAEGIQAWRDQATGRLVVHVRGRSYWLQDALTRGIVKATPRRG